MPEGAQDGVATAASAADGTVSFRKGDLAKRLGCCGRTLDRAVTRLRRDGLIVCTPVFGDNGGQLANEYRATAEGIHRVRAAKSSTRRRS